jgi:hypothetical protein
MDDSAVADFLTESLLIEASDEINGIAEEALGVSASWAAAGSDSGPTEWLAGLAQRLAWWSGRLMGCVDPETLSVVEPELAALVREAQAHHAPASGIP